LLTIVWGLLFVWLWAGEGVGGPVVLVIFLGVLFAGDFVVREFGHLVFHPAAPRVLPRSGLFWHLLADRIVAAAVWGLVVMAFSLAVFAVMWMVWGLSLGPWECLLLLGFGCLLFGRRLPELVRWVGKSIAP